MGGDRAVAGLYFFKELDCLIDLAHLVSLDFFDRPQLYRRVDGELGRDLGKLRSRYGYHEDYLSPEQRRDIFVGLFGECASAEGMTGLPGPPADTSFVGLRDQLLAAAAAFSERVYDTSEEILRATVRMMHPYLKVYLEQRTGASVAWSRDEGLPAIAGRCYRILRSTPIAARFGIDRAPSDRWPVEIDGYGSQLVEQISSTPIRGHAEAIPSGVFDDRQQLALRGAEALADIMDYKGELDSARTDHLIGACYQWYAARGRVLRLPVTVSPPATRQPLTPAAGGAPALAPASTNGNRSLYPAAYNSIPGMIS